MATTTGPHLAWSEQRAGHQGCGQTKGQATAHAETHADPSGEGPRVHSKEGNEANR
jgi:hypothetical protein